MSFVYRGLKATLKRHIVTDAEVLLLQTNQIMFDLFGGDNMSIQCGLQASVSKTHNFS